MAKIKSLQKVSEEIGETIGEFKKFNPANGYYKTSLRARTRGIELIDSKIRANLSFRGTKQPVSFGYFKSKQGYNSKYKNKKEYANHYGEYIAYIILKQLGKKACKVDIGELEVKNPYSNEIFEVEGILSHYQLSQSEIYVPFKVALEDYRGANYVKYRELTERGRTGSESNYTNIEIILIAIDDYFRKNGQAYKIPEARKKFFTMCMFDIKFANRDRHDENFGFKVNQDTDEVEFYHLFDNEQILGMQEERTNVEKYLSDEKKYMKFKQDSLTSYIGVPGKTQRIDPMELLRYLLVHYEAETMEALEDIGRYQLSDLEELLGYFPGLSNEHKELAKKIFKEREKEIENTVKACKRIQSKTKDEETSL